MKLISILSLPFPPPSLTWPTQLQETDSGILAPAFWGPNLERSFLPFPKPSYSKGPVLTYGYFAAFFLS